VGEARKLALPVLTLLWAGKVGAKTVKRGGGGRMQMGISEEGFEKCKKSTKSICIFCLLCVRPLTPVPPGAGPGDGARGPERAGLQEVQEVPLHQVLEGPGRGGHDAPTRWRPSHTGKHV